MIRIPVENIRTIGRVTQGNRLIRLEQNEQVIGIAPMIEDESDDEDEVKEDNLSVAENSTETITDPAADSSTDSAAENAPQNLAQEDIPEEPQDPPSTDDSSES